MTVSLLSFLFVPWLAGIGLSLITSSVGCLLVWRRLSFFGDALAHSALLGVALALFLDLPTFWGVLLVCVAMGFVLEYLTKDSGKNFQFASDTGLALLSYASLALGMVGMSKFSPSQIDMAHYLFGDILTVDWFDIYLIFGVAALVIGFLFYNWSALILITLNPDLAKAEGVAIVKLQTQLTIILALTIAVCLKFMGALLVPSLLIIPPAAVAIMAKSPKQMAYFAFFFSSVGISVGLIFSVWINIASGPSIVVTTLALFALIRLGFALKNSKGSFLGISSLKG